MSHDRFPNTLKSALDLSPNIRELCTQYSRILANQIDDEAYGDPKDVEIEEYNVKIVGSIMLVGLA